MSGTLLVVILIFLFLMALLGIKTIRPYERACVERLGKYQRTVQPGLNFIVPFIERLIKVDMREQVVDVPPQEVITKDNATVTVDAIIYYEVTDPVKVHGEEWRATAACEIHAGSTVRVVAVDGTHLVVESAKEGSC